MVNELCVPSFIRQQLTGRGFRFDKRLGQNFLTASWVPKRIAGLFSKGQAVLEIGPGFGALTAALAETCGKVVAVEKDRRLLPVLKENLSRYENVSLIEGDALRLDLASLGVTACAANLPYSITTPLLTRLLEQTCFCPVVLMVQKEVAQRLTAAPAAPEYGAVTVFTALHARCSILFDVSPDCFMPRPAVTSSVIRLDRLRTAAPNGGCGRETGDSTASALRIVKAAFSQRRKTLLNALSAGLVIPKELVGESVRAADIDPSARGETLSPEQFLILAKYF